MIDGRDAEPATGLGWTIVAVERSTPPSFGTNTAPTLTPASTRWSSVSCSATVPRPVNGPTVARVELSMNTGVPPFGRRPELVFVNTVRQLDVKCAQPL